MFAQTAAEARTAATNARSRFVVSEYAGAAEEVAEVAFRLCTRVRLGMDDPKVAADLLRRISAAQGPYLPARLDLDLLKTADEFSA